MRKLFFILFALLPSFLWSQKSYFQQKVNYTIKVKVNPAAKTLSAYERFVYYNNSPDTLRFIYIHLWPNAYQPGTDLARQLANRGNGKLIFGDKQYRGYIDSLDFHVNGQKTVWKPWKSKKDVAVLYLPEPLRPGDSAVITTPFFVKIPKISSRMGYDDNVIAISQWYPKPAVYDRYGWHPIPYLDQGEFYSEFGRFDVTITLPSQYAVAATGNLLDSVEYTWRKKLKDHKAQDVPYPTGKKWKTVRFVQDSVHDFAFFISNQYFARSSSIRLPHSGRTVETWTFFTDSASEWNEAVKYVDSAVYYYSLWVGDYPYKVCTAVEGPLSAGGGMEYPTITVVSSSIGLEAVIVHEVGHNWFYGILGFNERRYPFMDEGLNSFYDHRYHHMHHGLSFIEAMIPYDLPMSQIFALAAYGGYNQPLDLHSKDYTSTAYGLIVYEKTAFALRYLQLYLGEQEFDRVMKGFYQQWKFRHPYPEDLENFFEKNANKNVDWFFEGVVGSNKLIDYSVKACPDGIKVKNTGQIAAPMQVRYVSEGESIDRWILLNPNQKWTVPVDKVPARIDPRNITLDFYPYNNFTQGHWPNKKLKVSLLPKLFKNQYNYLSVTPLIYYRSVDGLMPGLAVYNFTLPFHRISYALAGFYGFRKSRPSLMGFITYQRPGINGFPQMTFSLYGDNFAIPDDAAFNRLRKFSARLKLTLWNKDMSDHWRKDMELAYFRLQTTASVYRNVYRFMINATRRGKYHPASYSLLAEQISDLNLALVSGAVEFMPVHYVSLNTGLNVRLFAGMNAPITAMTVQTDYSLSQAFVAKYDTTSIWSRQIFPGYGNFMLSTPTVNYPWSAGINLTSTLPVKKIAFIKAYFNSAYVPVEKWHWEAGLNIALGNWELYFPLAADPGIMAANPGFAPLRTFTFAFKAKLSDFVKF